ncbi:MAG TPA: (2Fe-2S)-binding protein [Myxococcota bacterium]|nr:(2Fe-2S)-binding protein [Myxococcota bacterium]
MPSELILELKVNGDRRAVLCPANRSLLDLLREDLGLTGSKHGCDIGDCGACTVLVDGSPTLACVTLAAEVEGRDITTIEGISADGLHPVQAALHEHVAAQCGYCTPGFVMNLVALLARDEGPSDEELVEALGANICRCTGYTKILAAARQARDS